MEQENISLEGMVESIVYKNDETGYAIFIADIDGQPVTIVGTLPFLFEGEHILASGQWTVHKTYGKQFRVDTFEKNLPTTTDAILKYLSSGVIRGIGAVTAGRIVDYYGDRALEVIAQEPSRLTRIKGISPAKARAISEAFQNQFGMRSLLVFLQQYGIAPYFAVKVWKRWGRQSVDRLRQNPYLLAEQIEGIGFEKADAIAMHMGYDEFSPFRLSAAVKYVLHQNAFNGHTFLPREQLVETTARLLRCQAEDIDRALTDLIEEEQLVSLPVGNKNAVYLAEYFHAESRCARRLQTMVRAAETKPLKQSVIRQIEQEIGITFEQRQADAIRYAAAGTMVLTGGPGTGKTTAVGGIIALYEKMGLNFALVAPTGRAAKRITELTGYEAKTIHRLLEMQYSDQGLLIFSRNEDNLLDFDAVICDESSMVDLLLFDALLRALPPSCRLILVGDADQLPSVGAGNVFADVIASGAVPTVKLEVIFRQAADSLIITNAHRIIQGESLLLQGEKKDVFFMPCRNAGECADTVVDLCCTRLPQRYGWDMDADIQVITPSKLGMCGTVNLNRRLKQVMDEAAAGLPEKAYFENSFRVGDKVMQIKNNYDIPYQTAAGEAGQGVFNGDIGKVRAISFENEELEIVYDDRVAKHPFESLDELDHAYAVTVHKCQGNEFRCVVLVIMDTPSALLYRNLLYTAVTRAREMLILVGDGAKIVRMIGNKTKVKRFSGLRHMLRGLVPTAGEREIEG